MTVPAIRMLATAFFVSLLMQACGADSKDRGQVPPRQVRQRPLDSRPAPPPPPGDSAKPYQHPVLRIPPAPRFDDPVRNPARPAVRVSGDDEPEYPEAARRARVQGVVIVEILIERDGRV